MRIVYDFPHGLPYEWPDNHKELTRVVEDGDEEALHIEYQDRQFVRPMAPWTVEQVREQVRTCKD